MKFWLSALALLAIAAPAAAQTTETPAAPIPPSTCGAIVAAPTLPDGATATREQMQTANDAYQAWGTSQQEVLRCRHDEAEALRRQLDARVAEHNAGVEAVNTATSTWQAEAEEFNARGNTGNRRR